MRKIGLTIVAVLMVMTGAFAQIHNPVKWSVAQKKLNSKEDVICNKATIQIVVNFNSHNIPDGQPLTTVFTFKPSKEYSLNGKTAEPKPKTKYEEVFKMNVPYFTQEVVFQQKVKLNSTKPTTVSGTVEWQACDKNQ